jgi:OCT family organic cation transporter-like MFS transporter 4/5
LVLVLCGIVSTISGIGAYQAVFTDAQPEHRCKLPMFENDTYEVYSNKQQQLINFYIPIDKASSKYDGCYIYSNITDNNTKSIEKCTSWVYSHDYYDTTIVTEWNLVCENATLKGYFRSIFFMGNMSVILIGMLADRFGRKKIAYLFIIMNTLAFLCMSLSVNLIKDPIWKKVLFGFSRFLVGFTVNTFALAAVIVIEIVGPSYRVFANIAMNYFYILGELTVLLVAYLERDYKIFSIYMTIMPCILILFFWMVPESVRYLVSQKRYEEADEIFKRIARSNKKV